MKKLYALLLTTLMLLSLTACGGGGEVTAKASDLANDLAKASVTGDSLSEISSDIMVSTYFVDAQKVEDSSALLSTGSTACEIAVIKCSSSDYASEVKTLFENRVKSQSDLYASYNAAEVTRLDSAIIKTSGSYVVLCVCDDVDAANEVLTKAGF